MKISANRLHSDRTKAAKFLAAFFFNLFPFRRVSLCAARPVKWSVAIFFCSMINYPIAEVLDIEKV